MSAPAGGATPGATFWAGWRVLVTGCTGFVGGWLVPRLLAEGALVVGLVRDGAPDSLFHRRGCADRVSVVRGQLEDFPLPEEEMQKSLAAIKNLPKPQVARTGRW